MTIVASRTREEYVEAQPNKDQKNSKLKYSIKNPLNKKIFTISPYKCINHGNGPF